MIKEVAVPEGKQVGEYSRRKTLESFMELLPHVPFVAPQCMQYSAIVVAGVLILPCTEGIENNGENIGLDLHQVHVHECPNDIVLIVCVQYEINTFS